MAVTAPRGIFRVRRCAACAETVENDSIGVRDTCARCHAYLHSCRHCDFYEPGMSRDCREPTADLVSDKEAGNFCDSFHWDPKRPPAKRESSAGSRAKLDALFGGKR